MSLKTVANQVGHQKLHGTDEIEEAELLAKAAKEAAEKKAAKMTPSVELFQKTLVLPQQTDYEAKTEPKEKSYKILDKNPLKLSTDVSEAVEKSEAATPAVLIDQGLDDTLSLLEAELAKGDQCNHTMLYELALQILVYLMRSSGRDDHMQIHKMANEIKKHVESIKDSYHNPAAIVIGILSATASFGAAFCGLSPIFGHRLFLAVETTKSLAGAATHLSSLSQAGQLAEKIADSGKNGEKTVLNHKKDEAEDRRRSRQNGKGDKKQTEQSALQSLSQLLQTLHSAIQSVLGG